MNILPSRAQPSKENFVSLEVISDVEGFRRLRLEWNDLLTRSVATSFFLTYEYLWTWWSVYGAAYKLRIVTARKFDGKLIGIAPMMIGASDRVRRPLLRHLAFIGGLGDACSEDQDFIVATSHEPLVINCFASVFLEELAGDWDIMELGTVPSESPCLSPLSSAIASVGGDLRCVEQRVAPYVRLPRTWNTYLATRSKNFRSSLRGRSRKLAGDCHIKILRAGQDIPVREALDIVASLSRERWGSASLAFRSENFCEFHSRLAEILVPRKLAYIAVMIVDGEAAAAGYDFIHGPKMFGFQGGWKKSLAHLGVGKIMLGKQIEWAIDQGLMEYDFLAGDSGYKADWATGQREFLELEVVNPRSLSGRTFKRLRQLRKDLKDAFSMK